MLREKIKFQGLISMAMDVLVIFISYVIAVYIRYEIMRSLPGLNTLSAPYLLIALAYSFIVASVLGFARSQRGADTGNYEQYGLFSINAISCLFLLAFLYTIGELYFSRWALVLFWLISSVMLFIKNILLTELLGRRTKKLSKGIRIVIIGSGENCNSYIRAVDFDRACDFNILGYIGKKSDIFFDHVFEYDSGEEGDREGWLGEYSETEEILKRAAPDEVVFALENEEAEILDELLPAVKKTGIKSSVIPGFGKYLPENAVIRHIDELRIIDLCAEEGKQTTGIYGLGLSLSVIFLILMLIIKHFRIGNVESFGLYESYRCFIFAMVGYFLYLSMERVLKIRKYRNTAAALSAGLISIALIVLYEAVYTRNMRFVQDVIPDLIMTVIVITVCWLAKAAVDYIKKGDYSMMV